MSPGALPSGAVQKKGGHIEFCSAFSTQKVMCGQRGHVVIAPLPGSPLPINGATPSRYWRGWLRLRPPFQPHASGWLIVHRNHLAGLAGYVSILT